jgi:hypothetical protein
MPCCRVDVVQVVIVLTDGALGDPTSPMWESLKSAGVKLFVYKFEDPDSLDASIITDQQQVCNIGGSYESFPMNRRQNPLFALQSYYDFVASTHTKMNSSVVYGYVYPDFVQADSEIFTISLPGTSTGFGTKTKKNKKKRTFLVFLWCETPTDM